MERANFKFSTSTAVTLSVVTTVSALAVAIAAGLYSYVADANTITAQFRSDIIQYTASVSSDLEELEHEVIAAARETREFTRQAGERLSIAADELKQVANGSAPLSTLLPVSATIELGTIVFTAGAFFLYRRPRQRKSRPKA
jgi:predicted PurR-regulated permease PerM